MTESTTHAQTQAWEQVGARFVALGKTLRRRLDELGAEASVERRAVERSLRSLADALESSCERTAVVARDPELRHDVAEIVASLRGAVMTTFAAADGQPVPAKKATAKKAAANKAAPKKAAARNIPARPVDGHPERGGSRAHPIRRALLPSQFSRSGLRWPSGRSAHCAMTSPDWVQSRPITTLHLHEPLPPETAPEVLLRGLGASTGRADHT